MKHHEWIRELTAEIRELEGLISKAEQHDDLEGKWVVYLLKSILKRRTQALRFASTTITKH